MLSISPANAQGPSTFSVPWCTLRIVLEMVASYNNVQGILSVGLTQLVLDFTHKELIHMWLYTFPPKRRKSDEPSVQPSWGGPWHDICEWQYLLWGHTGLPLV